MDDVTKTALQWPEAIYAQFQRVGIRQVGYVPDAGHSRLIELCVKDPDIHDVVLTTEEEGVGLVAGATLGGERAALLMQSSGVGNCINMFSLLRNCGFPCLLVVTMRGEFAEFNPWQVPMGSITEASPNGTVSVYVPPSSPGTAAYVGATFPATLSTISIECRAPGASVTAPSPTFAASTHSIDRH